MGPEQPIPIRQLESVTMNAWPGLRTYIFDGWIVRYSDGFTKRANSVSPLWNPTDTLESLIERCESFYETNGRPTVFKLTEESQPTTLDDELGDRGYRCADETSVRLKSLNGRRNSVDERVTLARDIPVSFVETYSRLWDLSERHARTFTKVIGSSLGTPVSATLEMNDRSVACGLAVLDQEFIGLMGIYVDEAFRRQGLGETITTALLTAGHIHGAKTAWLQVETENAEAGSLYESLGFTEAYQYWYRTTAQRRS
jgi:ribosomal protein S18 acetylase RimI-like enzyme